MKWLHSWPGRLISAAALFLFAGALLSGARIYGEAGQKPTERQEENAGGFCRIRMTYPVAEGVSVLSDLKEVEEAVNQISRKEIGVEVELIPEDMKDAPEDYLLWLSRGDTVDLMLVRDQDLNTYIDKGLIHSLSGYLQRNADAVWLMDTLTNGRLTGGAKQQGKLYGVANLSKQEAYGYGLWISAKILEETGIDYDPEHIYSLQEIDTLLQKLKSFYPDSYPLGQITAGQKQSSAVYYMDIEDPLGGDLLTGTVVGKTADGGNQATVENFFATEQYQEFLSYMERWYLAELIYPDSAVYDAPVKKLLEDQTIFMFPASSSPGTMDLMFGKETDYVCLKTTKIRKREVQKRDFWTVPSTSRYPKEAVRFLDLMYSDQRLAYLLNYGLSGEHYVISDEAEKLLAPVRKEDGVISGFYNPFADIGDTRELYTFGTPEQQREQEEYHRRAGQPSAYEGFVCSTAGVSRQIDAVRKVADIYLPILESGSADMQENYSEFLRELEEAGISEIIENKQTQFSAWLAQKNTSPEEN